jgi:putative membrane protein
MYRSIPILAASWLACVALSCDDDDDIDNPISTFAPTEPNDGGVHTDGQVVDAMITANSGEVAEGALAQSRASNLKVRNFGTLMVTDHTAAGQALGQLASAQGITPEPNEVSNALKAESDATSTQLQGLSGASFDTAYIDAQVTEHTSLLSMLDNVLIPTAQNPVLATELNRERTIVNEHLNQAKQIQASLLTTPPPAAGGGGSGGDNPY